MNTGNACECYEPAERTHLNDRYSIIQRSLDPFEALKSYRVFPIIREATGYLAQKNFPFNFNIDRISMTRICELFKHVIQISFSSNRAHGRFIAHDDVAKVRGIRESFLLE